MVSYIDPAGLTPPPTGFVGPWAGVNPMAAGPEGGVKPLATGLICVGNNGQLYLAPQASQPALGTMSAPLSPAANPDSVTPLATGLICVGSNGQLYLAPQGSQGGPGPMSSLFPAAATADSPSQAGLIPLCV